MDKKYTVYLSDRLLHNYNKEYRHSVKEWGLDHADKHFSKVDEFISSLEYMGSSFSGVSKNKEYRINQITSGLKMLYHTDEKNKKVSVIDIAGKHRYRELEQKAKTRKTKPRADHRLTAPADEK